MSGRWDRARLRRAASSILSTALAAAQPARLVRSHLRLRGALLEVAGLSHRLGRGHLVLVAAGKAAPAMARAAEDRLGRRLDAALAISTAATVELRHTRLLLAGHPVPDARGLAAAAEVESLCRSLGRDDLLLVLLSGGASALLPAPVAGVSLEEKAAATAVLLRAGATIHELNAVRKHLSRLKGGGLARLAGRARVAALVLSDVVGDDCSTIGSGPTVPDPTTYADALAALDRCGVRRLVPRAVREYLEAGERGQHPETPKPGGAGGRRVSTHIVGSNRLSVEAAARSARRLGLRPLVLTTRLEGEAREVSRALVAVLRECAEAGRPVRPPACLLAGGETTVTVRGRGRGGRNLEIVLAAVEPLAGFPSHSVVASLATDGVDGSSDAAGAIADQESLRRARELRLPPPAAALAENDTHGFFDPLGDLIRTGPTGTNVVDLTLLLAGSLMRRL